jgi:hypothetical protein
MCVRRLFDEIIELAMKQVCRGSEVRFCAINFRTMQGSCCPSAPADSARPTIR